MASERQPSIGTATLRAATQSWRLHAKLILCVSSLRLGHICDAFVLSIVDALEESTIDVPAAFVVVAERRDTGFRVRARNEPPW
jgi:hypothetical protein